MQTPTRLCIVAAVASGLAACGTADIREMQVNGSDFERNLRDGYIDLADAEYDETDIKDGKAFAHRAKLAAMGTPPAPEALDARELPAQYRGELSEARGKLVKALDGGAAKSSPRHAAAAQVAFDCWMQEAEENLQPWDIASCKGKFNAAMGEIGAPKMAEAPKPAEPMAEKKPMAKPMTPPPQTLRYVLYFGLDKSNLSGEASKALRQIKANIGKTDGTMVKVSGYADRAGTENYNDRLAGRRVSTVVNALQGMGVQKASIATASYGEANPAVNTPDGVPEPRNRRVEISVIK